jgi:[ribosomal protein S5]-alanine N-acetyltransferase
MEFNLRPWRANDIDSLVKFANNYNIAKNLTDQFPFPYTKEAGEKYLAMVIRDNPPKIFAIEINGVAAGSIGVFPQQDIHSKNAEMGYWLAEDYWGQGIVCEAIKQMVVYGFDTFGINRIFARPFGSNLQSQRVLEKAGFTLEATFKGAIFKNGEFVDELIYSIRK